MKIITIASSIIILSIYLLLVSPSYGNEYDLDLEDRVRLLQEKVGLEYAPHSFCLTQVAIEILSDKTLGENEKKELLLLLHPKMERTIQGGKKKRAGKDICEGYYYPYHDESTNFVLEWEDNSLDDNALETLLESMEESWSIEVDNEGYSPPEGSDEYLVEVFVEPIGWEGAYTSIYEGCGYYLPFIVFDPSILDYDDWIMDISAHEFFHAIQFGYYAYYEDIWWWEATATWMEDIVYPDINLYTRSIPYYSNFPYLPMDYENYAHEYGMCIFAKYLEEYRGGTGTIREIWEEARNRPYEDFIDILSDISNISLSQLFSDWTGRTSVMDYEEGHLYEDVKLTKEHKNYPVEVTRDDDDDLPHFGGTNYILLIPDKDEDYSTLYLFFEGETRIKGREIEWAVSVTKVKVDGSYEYMNVQTNDSGQAGIEIDGWKNEVSALYLAFTPVTEFDDDDMGASYRYIASYEPVDEIDWDDGDDDDGTTRLSDIDRERSYPSCSCSLSPPGFVY